MYKRNITLIVKSSAVISMFCIATSVAQAASWGYEPEEIPPVEWGSIPDFKVCGIGNKQSPIDFSQSKLTSKTMRVKVKNLPDLKFEYQPSPLEVINNGHTIEFEYEPGSVVTLEPGGEQFQILQFHFHAPAEHSFEKGALYEMEMHIVHQSLSDPNQLAVVGVMIREGDENVALAPIWSNAANLINEGDQVSDHLQFVNVFDALPSDKRYFSYSGSLTTPPCSEIVEWKVLREPIEMSRAQIHSFISILDNSCCAVNGNNRPVQAINERRITLDKKADSDFEYEEDDIHEDEDKKGSLDTDSN